MSSSQLQEQLEKKLINFRQLQTGDWFLLRYF
jgi:hypothetical protein